MTKKINTRTKISALLSVDGQNALAEIPRRWHTDRQNVTTIVRIEPQAWHRTESHARSRVVRPEAARKQRHLTSVPASAPTLDLDQNPRQWLLTHNPQLANAIAATIGERWISQLEHLQQLSTFADNPLFQLQWRALKQVNKQIFATEVARTLGIEIDVNSLFDLHLQQIDGRQRQLLNILHIIHLYHQIKANPALDIVPRTFIFGEVGEPIATSTLTTEADLEPSARSHQEIITQLIHSLAAKVAADPDLRGKIKVVYVPQSAGLNDLMYLAADLTEQIATAGMEEVDLNQFKFAINGVLSIGSMSKANHLLQQAVGADNCFSFGLAIPEIAMFKEYGYNPYNYYKYYPEIGRAIDSLLAGEFTPTSPDLCQSLLNDLLATDEYMVLADCVFYLACQAHVDRLYRQTSLWTRMSILNVAGVG